MPIIQSLDRALKMLDLFDEFHKELKITEISKRMELHKSTVHSLLKTMQSHGYIEQDSESGKYRLGLKLLERGHFVHQTMDLRLIVRPFIEQLSRQTGQTTHLVVLDGREGVYIDKVDGKQAVIRYSHIGKRVQLHSSAVGKVLIAHQPPFIIEQLMQGYEYKKLTAHTIDNPQDFLAEIEKIKAAGYAIDDEENELGVRCFGIPIRDHSGEVKASISLSLLPARTSEKDIEAYLRLLIKTGEEISAKLGYRFSDRSFMS